MRKKKKDQMKEFLVEVRACADEGYSKRQLASSLIPDIGTEIKVAESEVTAALKGTQVAFRGQGRGIIDYVLVLCCVKVFYFHCLFFWIQFSYFIVYIVYISIGSYHFIAVRAPNYFVICVPSLFACPPPVGGSTREPFLGLSLY